VHELSVCEGIIDVATNALARLACPLPPVSCVPVRIGRRTVICSHLIFKGNRVIGEPSAYLAHREIRRNFLRDQSLDFARKISDNLEWG
jgi:hypothetical protein